MGRDDLGQRLSVKEPRESLLARPLFSQQIAIIAALRTNQHFSLKISVVYSPYKHIYVP